MVSVGGETNYANTDHEVHTNKATNSYYLRSPLFDFCELLLAVKFKGDGDAWLTGWLTHPLFHFILSYPVKVITFLSLNSLVFNLLLGLEVLTFYYIRLLLRHSPITVHVWTSTRLPFLSSTGPVINDVASDPFSSTLDEMARAFLIIAYSMQEGSARKATSFRHQE